MIMAEVVAEVVEVTCKKVVDINMASGIKFGLKLCFKFLKA